METVIGLKQFRSDGCLSYLVWDRASRAAAAIDPTVDLMDEYRSFVADRRLSLLYVLETHTHADHYSASHWLRDQFGARIGMSHATEGERASLRLRQGERLPLGGLAIEVLETPGHTPDSACYLVEGVLFTGDTLMIGSTGRADFPGSDPLAQHRSLHQTLGALPASTVVMPGHDYSDLVCSTLGLERKRNPQLQIADASAFAALKREEVLATGVAEMAAQLAFNRAASPASAPVASPACGRTACGAALPADDRFASINVEKFAHKLREHPRGAEFVDVREPEEFEGAHIPGTRNIPLSEIGLHLKELVRPSSRVFVSCLSGRRSLSAAKTLSYLGAEDVVNVSGGFKAWQQAGLPVEKG